MRRTGIWLVVFGVLSFTLPPFGYDLTWFEYLGGAPDVVAAGVILVGAALLVIGWRRKKASADGTKAEDGR
jgi:hypothetical protein